MIGRTLMTAMLIWPFALMADTDTALPNPDDMSDIANGVATLVRTFGADVSGDSVISASFNGLHLDLGEAGGRLRFNLDGTTIGLGTDRNRLDLEASGPIEYGSAIDTGDDTTGGDVFSDAYQLSLRYTRIIWNVGQQAEVNTLPDRNCQHFKKVTGASGFCNDQFFEKEYDYTPDGYAGSQEAADRNRELIRQEYLRAQAIFLNARSVNKQCISAVRVVDTDIDVEWQQFLPPYVASQLRDCVRSSSLKTFRLAANVGAQTIDPSVTADSMAVTGERQETPFSIVAAFGMQLGDVSSISIGAAWERGYSEGELRQQCTDTGNNLLCQDVRFDAGVESENAVAMLDIRRRIGTDLAIKLVTSHAISDSITRVSLPLYLSRSEANGGLDGGIAMEWDSETEEARFRFFVGQTFSIAGQ